MKSTYLEFIGICIGFILLCIASSEGEYFPIPNLLAGLTLMVMVIKWRTV